MTKEQTKANSDLQRRYERTIQQLTMDSKPIQVQHTIYENQSSETYDVFISHASEDKESFVDSLYSELVNAGFKVWYDTTDIAWGDSLRSKIDKGLAMSKYGIVVISKAYIRKGWTQYELDGLFNIEMTQGKTILPIWHDITKQEVQDFSPSLAGRKALMSQLMTPAEIATELKKLFV